MMYTIRIFYSTGDSFGSEKTHDDIPMIWSKLDYAKSALEVIKLHKEACDKLRDRKYKSDWESIRDEYSGEYWFLPSNNGEEFYGFNVMDDTCRLQKINAFWMGYFETIHRAEIVEYVEEGSLNGMFIDFY